MLSAFCRPSASRRSRAQSGTQSGATARRPRIGVERLERKLLLAVNVTNLDDSGAGSLRAAIEAVNSPGATDYSIVFQNLVGTIYTKSALPTLAVSGTTFTTAGTSAIRKSLSSKRNDSLSSTKLRKSYTTGGQMFGQTF